MTDVASLQTERFRSIYDDLYADLTSYCRRRVQPDDVADMVAQSLMVVWQRLDDVPIGEAARPWAFAVARNLINNHWRKGQRSDALHDVLVAELLVANQRSVERLGGPRLEFDQLEALVEALHRLRPAEQELIRLATWEELSHAEVAVVLGCSINAVAIRLLRARAHLTDLLARDARWDSPAPTGRLSTKEKMKALDPARHVVAEGRKTAENSMAKKPRQEGCQ